MPSYAGVKPYEPFMVPQTEAASGQPVYFFPALAKILTSAEQRIFVAIKSFADYETGYCYPSLNKIADRAGCHRSTVAHTIPRLISKGLLRRHRRLRSDVFTESTNGDCFMSNEYCVNMGDKPWPVKAAAPDPQEQHHLELLDRAEQKAAEYRQSDRYRANLILRKVKAGKLTSIEALDSMKALLKAPADLVSKLTLSTSPSPSPSGSKNAREEIFRILSSNVFTLTKEEKKKLSNVLLERFPTASLEEIASCAQYLNKVALTAQSGNQQIKSKCGYLLGTIKKMDMNSVAAPASVQSLIPSPVSVISSEEAQQSKNSMLKLLQDLKKP